MAERVPVGVLISGRGSNMAALLYAAKHPDCPFEVVLVAANDPDAPGLAVARAEAIATWAESHRGVGRDAFDARLSDALEEHGARYVALAGYMRLLSPGFVARWTGRLVNIHPSLLPAHKGLDTHAAVLAAGERETGCTVHIVTEALDDGPILGQTRVAVLADDTVESLAARVLIAEHQLYAPTLAALVTQPFDAAWIEARLDAIAAALPEVFRKTSHGSPGWGVGSEKTGKLFAILADRHHGDEAIAVLVKGAGPDEMGALIEDRPDVYYSPKYYGASGWLGLKLNRADVDWDAVGDWLERSWNACAPPRLTRLARAAAEF